MFLKCLLTAMLALPLAASGQDTSAPAAVLVPSALPAAPGLPVPGLGTPAAPARLAGSRGGSDGPINDTRLTGTVSGNSANQVVTGANIIQASSFADAAGIPIVIQNSGANVLIQNATVVNLRLQ